MEKVMSKSKKTSKVKAEKNYLIFIDTNILLDFYNVYVEKSSINYLKDIDGIKERLIISSQLEMEFKRNRQYRINQEIDKLKSSKNKEFYLPRFMTNYKNSKSIKDQIKALNGEYNNIINEAINILENPNKFDLIYKELNKIFSYDSKFNLNENHIDYDEIIKLAEKRFHIGNPPRKNRDINWGDSIHWEWIINCLKRSNQNLIIVTRDSDFGITINKKVYLNDMLKNELNERVSDIIKVVITADLVEALELLDITIPIDMKEEQDIINNNQFRFEDFYSFPNYSGSTFLGNNNQHSSNIFQNPLNINSLENINNSLRFAPIGIQGYNRFQGIQMNDPQDASDELGYITVGKQIPSSDKVLEVDEQQNINIENESQIENSKINKDALVNKTIKKKNKSSKKENSASSKNKK